MERVLTDVEMRESDRHTIEKCGISAGQLMQNAGKAIADEVEKAAIALNAESILVVCGLGNNGGDGYVCAQELFRRNFNVKVYAFEGRLSPECMLAKHSCKCGYSRDICGAIIVDCIFGTGLCRNVDGEFAEVINKINESGAYVISADIPSGINGGNGLKYGVAVKADLTVAIAEYKTGHFFNDGTDYCGKIIKREIGIICPQSDYALIYGDGDITKFFPPRKRNSHKGTYGSANLIAGSHKYLGAAALAVQSALKSGCGYVKLTSEQTVTAALAPVYPSVIYTEEADLSCGAIAVGMGCGVSEKLYSLLKYLLCEFSGTLVIDADGLNCLAAFGTDILKEKRCNVLITPHVKEFSRLTGKSVDEIAADPITAAKTFAKENGVSVLLKSAVSVVTDGERAALNIVGNTALAKAGSGDILSGFVCGTLARGLSAYEAAVASAYVLGSAAEIAAAEKTEYCADASDVINCLHFAIKRLTK